MTPRLIFPRLFAAICFLALMALSGCDDKKSYSELLTDEDQAVNRFLADQRVDDSFPTDGSYAIGPDAPFYRMDQDGNVYMQILNPGNAARPDTGNRVYFRYVRYNLLRYESGTELTGMGNSENLSGAVYFLYNNFDLESSAVYGTGIQVPMQWLGSDAKVRLIIKSQFGWTSETANVIPFLYDIQYYESPMFPWTGETEQN